MNLKGLFAALKGVCLSSVGGSWRNTEGVPIREDI